MTPTNDKIPIWQLPKILWASTVLFTVNVVIAVAIAASPEMNIDILGEAKGDVVLAGTKPTAFIEPEPKPRPVRMATKLTPVVEQEPVVAMDYSLDIPRATVRAASATIPAPASVPAVYSMGVENALDVAPRKVSIREVRPVVMN